MFDTVPTLPRRRGRNDPNVSIWVSPIAFAALAMGRRVRRADRGDKNIGGEVDQAYRISVPVQTLDLVGIQPPKSQGQLVHISQRNILYQDGIAGFKVQPTERSSWTVSSPPIRPTVTAQPDITWLDVETRAQMVYFVRYNRQRITQIFGRKRARRRQPVSDNAGIVTPRSSRRNASTSTRSSNRRLVENSTRSRRRLSWNGPPIRTGSTPTCRSTLSISSASSRRTRLPFCSTRLNENRSSAGPSTREPQSARPCRRCCGGVSRRRSG